MLVAQSCRTPCNPMDRNLYPWDYPGKNTGVGSHSLLQGIFLTQRSKLGSPTLQADSLPPESPGSIGMERYSWILSFLWQPEQITTT